VPQLSLLLLENTEVA